MPARTSARPIAADDRLDAGGERRGALVLVGTPIGNLRDLTLRAVDALRAADRVAAEDTRRTRALLSHLDIHDKPLVSLDAHAHPTKIARLVARTCAGERIAIVTDAGMPGISDPGAAVVREATRQGARVEVIPGPSALTAAVSLSGLVDGAFTFLGFLPRKGGKRREALARVAASPCPVVLFEAPGRTGRTLAELAELLPGREACVARELTKLHEEVARGTLAELAARPEWLGEVVVVIAGRAHDDEDVPSSADLEDRIRARLAAGAKTREIAAVLAAETGLARRELYALADRIKRETAEPDEDRAD